MFAGDAPTVVILPDQGFYQPGDTVHITVRASAGSHVQAQVMYLNTLITTLEAPLAEGQAVLEWTPPPDAPRGYGLNVTITDEAGAVVVARSSAFDVLARWIDAPRYGFFSDFSPARIGGTDDETAEWLLEHHINGIQFYDWQYRWEDLVPENDRFEDGLGRPQSMATVRRLIDLIHQYKIAAMPYTAIYGASMAFFRQHEDWGMFNAAGEPYLFGDNLIGIMDATPGSPWNQHLMAEYADVLDETAFDGIHIDQYGAPKTGFDSAGNYVDLAVVMPQFIDQAAAIVDERRGDAGVTLFNCVGNWPIDAVAPAQQDAAYIEVWSPYTDYLDLNRIITHAEEAGSGKPVILAAYIPPDRTLNWQLANSVILASGGTHLETGELNSMLADPYFPRFGRLHGAPLDSFRRYYDFQVRYENVLSTTTTAADYARQSDIDLGEIRTHGITSRNRVVPILRTGSSFETISLVNFVGVDGTDWNAPTTVAPTPFTNISVQLPVTRPVSAVWFASPDDETTMGSTALAYAVEGGMLQFTLPSLNLWSMIVVEYANGR
ncbi:MAG: glycoside hydrolase family 66 protein [Anaerolineae bacterium]